MVQMDRDRFGEGFMFYINDKISSKVLTLESIPRDREIILLNFTLKNGKWLSIELYTYGIHYEVDPVPNPELQESWTICKNSLYWLRIHFW